MSRTASPPRELIPGSTGWSARDLDDPRVGRAWEAGHFQIIEGVLAIMPPAYWDNSAALDALLDILKPYLHERGLPTRFGCEVDVVVGDLRVPKADAVYMSAEDLAKQRRAKSPRTPKRLTYGRLRVPPTLVIENVSKGHENEDRVVKHAFYEQAGIPNYWILDVYQRTLECFALKRGKYVLDRVGRGKGSVSPRCFKGLTIELSKVWAGE
jgi:Uma2 family endonuclease